MKLKICHPWELDKRGALALQRSFATKVIREDALEEVKYVGGVDVAYAKDEDRLVAAAVILNADSLEVVETAVAEDNIKFPYIPGLFSFRELPPIVKALGRLDNTPDLIVCDGHGIAHPRRFGLACHLGIIFDVPTIGCAKTRLIGRFGDIGTKRGDWASLIHKGEIIGNVLRSQTDVKYLYVSIGHRISLETACHWILKLSPKFRLPETTRQADQAVCRALNKYHH